MPPHPTSQLTFSSSPGQPLPLKQKILLMRKFTSETGSFSLSLSLSLSAGFYFARGSQSWFSCCLWKAAGWVSKVNCLHICRVPSVQDLPGAGDPGSGHRRLQLREKRVAVRKARLCDTERRTKRWLSPGKQRGRAKRTLSFLVSVEPRGSTLREMRTLKQWLQKFRGKYLPGVLVVKGNH